MNIWREEDMMPEEDNVIPIAEGCEEGDIVNQV